MRRDAIYNFLDGISKVGRKKPLLSLRGFFLPAVYPKKSLPVPFLFPWIGVVMVAALLPETRAVALHKLQAIEPFGALIEVELGHQQAHRATMFGFQILTVVLESNHYIIIIEIGKREIGR